MLQQQYVNSGQSSQTLIRVNSHLNQTFTSGCSLTLVYNCNDPGLLPITTYPHIGLFKGAGHISNQKAFVELERFNETPQLDGQSCLPVDLSGLGRGPCPRRNGAMAINPPNLLKPISPRKRQPIPDTISDSSMRSPLCSAPSPCRGECGLPSAAPWPRRLLGFSPSSGDWL